MDHHPDATGGHRAVLPACHLGDHPARHRPRVAVEDHGSNHAVTHRSADPTSHHTDDAIGHHTDHTVLRGALGLAETVVADPRAGDVTTPAATEPATPAMTTPTASSVTTPTSPPVTTPAPAAR
ncbi:hypothetical protein [Nocardia thailandica]|uniref:hypothetical protein n=1 Tax=Nocardia thailandica TaxID=257275 RepID=UPI0002FCB7C1|nr:hypothetical protein [Nocardia thailandica]